jgi:hypothetical protein
MKRFQVFLMMIFLNICLAQDITLKKLYDGIEDMKLEVNTPLSTRDDVDTRYLAENRKLSKLIGERVNRYCNGGIDLSKKLEYGEVYVDKLIRGSFTKPNSKQELYHIAFCELSSGIVIAENDKVISLYAFSDHDFNFFSVKDVNQNGLNEIMVIVQKPRDSGAKCTQCNSSSFLKIYQKVWVVSLLEAIQVPGLMGERIILLLVHLEHLKNIEKTFQAILFMYKKTKHLCSFLKDGK